MMNQVSSLNQALDGKLISHQGTVNVEASSHGIEMCNLCFTQLHRGSQILAQETELLDP